MASDDDLHSVYAAHRENQIRLTYYLLAIAGAGLAFCLTQTQNAPLQISQIPLGLAGLLWTASIIFGYFQLSFVNLALERNLESMTFRLSGAESEARCASAQAGAWQFRQTVSAALGAIFFLVGHVWAMYLHIPSGH
jgi:hypothetical protein